MVRKCMVGVGVLSLVVLFSSSSFAAHSWGKYKWEPASIPFNLNLVDNVDSRWDEHLVAGSNDWSLSEVLGTTIVPGSTAAAATCDPVLGNVQVCNDAYGSTGWLGIAQIYTYRGKAKNEIVAGVVKLNDTYFNTAYYNTVAWRQMVMCQEIAHTFGLAHQDATFDNVNLGTCMDYTDDPDGTIDGELSNEGPNQHDYDQLTTIYTVSESTDDSGDCNPKSPKCNPALAAGGHAQWGQLVSGRGAKEVYVKDLGHGNQVITYVTRTLEYAKSHRH